MKHQHSIAGEDLFAAAREGTAVVVYRKLRERTDPNYVREFKGRTPLMVAAYFRHYDCCVALMEAGARTDICDTDPGWSVLEYAKRGGDERIIAMVASDFPPNIVPQLEVV